MTAPRRSNEQGSALVMALVFIGVISVLLTVLLSRTTTSLRASRVVQEHTDQLYLADAGLQHAVEQVRLDSTLCAGDPIVAPENLVIDGRTITFECEITAGAPPGAEGWAVITTTNAVEGITTQSGSDPKWIRGPVYSARLGSSPDLRVTDGSLLEGRSGSSCSTDADKPSSVSISPSPPYGYECTDRAVPDPDHALPAVPAAAAGYTQQLNGCRVHHPGTYTSVAGNSNDAPTAGVFNLDNHNFFESGVYYFNNLGTIAVNKAVIIGGVRGALESAINDTVGTPCATYAEGLSGTATGVQLVFGGNTRMEVETKGHVELFAFSDPSSAAEEGISVRAATSADAGYTASTTGTGTALLRVQSGNNRELTIHGMVYAPQSYIDYFGTNANEPQLRGGVVVARLHLQASSSVSGTEPLVSTDGHPETRSVRITATVESSVSGAVAVEAEAILDLEEDEITSWRTGRVP